MLSIYTGLVKTLHQRWNFSDEFLSVFVLIYRSSAELDDSALRKPAALA